MRTSVSKPSVDRAQLATLLIEADDGERAALVRQHTALVDAELARELKAAVYDAWSSEPPRSVQAAAALHALAGASDDAEITALAAWCDGIAALIEGQMERAIERFEAAHADFEALGLFHDAAATQVPKLIALAMLGRYDEAIALGLRTRNVFVEQGDALAAGKIEQNLGNLYFRLEKFAEGERRYQAALEHFETAQVPGEVANARLNLANIWTQQHRFGEAEQQYAEVLRWAEQAGQDWTCALAELNLGSLAFFRGRYDSALEYLERSRRRYQSFGMRHESAAVEQELADAYLELNLVPEAAAIYAAVEPVFEQLGLRADLARALAYHGRAALVLGRIEQARSLLARAKSLYAAEGNDTGAAYVRLIEAQLNFNAADYGAAELAAFEAEQVLIPAGAIGRGLVARWLRGEALRAQDRADEALLVVEDTRLAAEQQLVPQIAVRCHTSLGLIAAGEQKRDRAEQHFRHAVELIETLRAPLPAEEFRTAFVQDKLTPYAELVRLCITDTADRTTEALGYVERSRSRALLDLLAGVFPIRSEPRDDFEARLAAQITELREQLNWLYSQISRSGEGDTGRGTDAVSELYATVRQREGDLSTLIRRFQQRGADLAVAPADSFDVAQLQRDLGPDTILIEYFTLDNELLAFVVTDSAVEVVREVGDVSQIEAALAQFHFQIESLRYGKRRLGSHLDQLTSRTRQHLHTLYGQLLAPIEPLLGTHRLVVVPHRELYYVPFHALYDGTAYVVERREVCYAPSASILHHCLTRPPTALQRAVLVGVPDDGTPHVRDEVHALAQLFPDCVTLLDEQASVAAVRQHAATAGILHLACHGQFRPDNPLFSSLRLADGWLTVRDTYDFDLSCGLVVLSACETGRSAVSPGDEIIGLARGFFSAGAPTLLVSLWTVDDEATRDLMTGFYRRLRAGATPAAALRHAQRELMREQPHPYYWSPFMVLGRW